MSYRDIVSDDDRKAGTCMHDDAVLHIRIFADTDLRRNAANHGVVPHAAVFADRDIKDNPGSFGEKYRIINSSHVKHLPSANQV